MDVRSRRRTPRIDPRVLDAVVATVLFLLLAFSFEAPVHPGQRPVDPWTWVLAIGLTAPYAVHRRRPWVSLTVVLGSLVVFSLLHYAPYPGLSVFVLIFGLALHGRRKDSLVALGATAVVFAVALVSQPAGVVAVSDVISTMLATAVAWLLADNLRQRRLRWAAMEDRAQLLEREREDRDRVAVAAERLRIARELHDVVAHSMSVIAVQAGMGRHLIDTDAAAARGALEVIESTSRAALTEIRGMLGVLRHEDESAALHPLPGLADIPALVAETRRAGLGVTLDATGAHGDLPTGVDLAAYRVVQEALTNVLRHGGPVAHVRVTCAAERVELEVVDEGRPNGGRPNGGRPGGRHLDGAPAAVPGSRHGLLGMRERVEVYGGSFAAGPRPGGGYRVHAVLPYAGGPR